MTFFMGSLKPSCSLIASMRLGLSSFQSSYLYAKCVLPLHCGISFVFTAKTFFTAIQNSDTICLAIYSLLEIVVSPRNLTQNSASAPKIFNQLTKLRHLRLLFPTKPLLNKQQLFYINHKFPRSPQIFQIGNSIIPELIARFFSILVVTQMIPGFCCSSLSFPAPTRKIDALDLNPFLSEQIFIHPRAQSDTC